MRVFAKTDVGIMRTNNEDFYLYDEAAGVFVVTDGMGGHKAGEVASEIAARTIVEDFAALTNQGMTIEFESSIEAILKNANQRILEYVEKNPDCRGMGTTAVVVRTSGGDLWIANVGDSRIYGITDSEIEQLSTDHSLVAELVRIGSISAEEAAHHPDKNIITSALGAESDFEIFKAYYKTEDFKYILLCSDGLTNMVSDSDILKVFRDNDLASVPEKLVDLANENGGQDNITAVCIEL
jgi:protein phosphatase